jgi:hypothetical protein
MLRLLLFPVSVEAPHFRRSFWKTAVRKLKRGIQRALSRDSQFCQRTAALRPVGLRDRSSLRRRSASLRSPAACKTSKFLRPKLRVALDPNRKIDSPNFCPPNWAQKAVGPAQSSRQAAERLVCTLTRVAVFRKTMSFLCRGETRHRRRRANGHEWDWEIV